jgi:hypothetical protein
MAKKLYIHRGEGHYVGSVVVAIAEDLDTASMLIRGKLDEMGLFSEDLDIVESDTESNSVVLSIFVDY